MANDLELVQNHCTELFSRKPVLHLSCQTNPLIVKDYVMEPQVVSTVLAFFQAGGQPERVIDLLSSNYHGYGQLANLFGSWLADLEDTKSISASPFKAGTRSSTDNALLNAKAKIE